MLINFTEYRVLVSAVSKCTPRGCAQPAPLVLALTYRNEAQTVNRTGNLLLAAAADGERYSHYGNKYGKADLMKKCL